MAGSAGSIFVDLLLNDAKFIQSVKNSQKEFKNFGSSVEATAKGISVGISLIGGAMAALEVHQLRAIDDTSKMARSLGIATDEFQAMSLVAKEAGVDQEQLGVFLTKTQKAIVDAAKGTGEFTAVFRALHLDAKKLLDLKPEQQFAKISEAISNIQNQAIRTDIITQIFGKQGRAGQDMIIDYNNKLKEAKEFNDKFGVSINSIDSRKIEEANDAFGRLTEAMKGFFNILSVKIAPIITEISKDLLDLGVDGATAAGAINSAFEAVATTIDLVRQAKLGLKAELVDIVKSFNEATLDTARKDLQEAIDKGQSPEKIAKIRREIEGMEAMIMAADDAMADINKQAAEFEKTSEKIAKIQADAQKRAADAKERDKIKGAGGGIDFESLTKHASALSDINSNIESQIQLTAIENEHIDEGANAVKRLQEEQQIIFNLKKNNIDISDEELAGIRSQLDHLEEVRNINEDIKNEKKEQIEAAEQLRKAEEEQQKRLEDSVQLLRVDLAKGLTDAIFNSDNLADSFKNIAKRIAESVVQEALLRSITQVTGGTEGARGGGLIGGLAPFISLLPSFAVGTNYVPHDMLARIHEGETIIPKPQADILRQGGGNVTMNVYTPDANSFRASDRQITQKLKRRIGAA